MSELSAIFSPEQLSAKMAMGDTSSNACKISMLWNWYTIDACFLAKSWHVKSRGMFAGVCIGVFFWVVAYCWFHRFIVEFDHSIIDYKMKKFNFQETPVVVDCCCEVEGENQSTLSSSNKDNMVVVDSDAKPVQPGQDFWTPLKSTLSHKWLSFSAKKEQNKIYPTALEHSARSGLYLMEWTTSYLLMLMWMYYNGYIIITMILGYFFGQLLFNYTPLTMIDVKNEQTIVAAPAHP